jgi:hypothetical protein
MLAWPQRVRRCVHAAIRRRAHRDSLLFPRPASFCKEINDSHRSPAAEEGDRRPPEGGYQPKRHLAAGEGLSLLLKQFLHCGDPTSFLFSVSSRAALVVQSSRVRHCFWFLITIRNRKSFPFVFCASPRLSIGLLPCQSWTCSESHLALLMVALCARFPPKIRDGSPGSPRPDLLCDVSKQQVARLMQRAT